MRNPPARWDLALQSAAGKRQELARERSRRALASCGAVKVTDGTQTFINFSANDYLGLRGDPEIAAALANAATELGAGSGASALVTGFHPAHQALETSLAEYLEREAVLLVSSGYLANLAALGGLAGRGDTVVQDRLCHASLIDGARVSGAELRRFPHADPTGAERQLQAAGNGKTLLVTDGVFSMDGDVAPLQALADLASREGALLMVDDAHGIGVVGPRGRGSVAQAGLSSADVPVLVGTLGKAFGCAGAFIAAERQVIDHLVNTARSYIFSTAMPPALAVAARSALDKVRDEEWRREQLNERVIAFREGAKTRGISVLPSNSAIQPLLLGDDRAATQASDALAERGFLVTAIRPPTVPEGTARLRITLSTAHEPAQVEALLNALADIRESQA